MVTHDVEFAAECGFDIALLVDGKILAEGSASQVLSNPKLLRQASLLPPQLVDLSLSLGFRKPASSLEEVEALILERIGGSTL